MYYYWYFGVDGHPVARDKEHTGGTRTRIVIANCKIVEIDTVPISNSDGIGAHVTDIGRGPPDYTSESPVCYGYPDSIAKRDGDTWADVYYIIEDTGTRSG